MQGVLDPRERKYYLVTLLVDFAEVRQEAPTSKLLLCQQDGRREGAGAVSYQAVRDHLVRLIVDDFSHFGSRSVRGYVDGWQIPVFEIGPIMDKMSLSIVAVMTRECLCMIDLQQLFKSSLIGQGSLRELSPIQLELFGSRRDIRCLLYTSPSPRDGLLSRMPSSA